MLSCFSHKIILISNDKSFISHTLKVVGPLKKKFDFFSRSGLEIQAVLITKSQKSSSAQSELQNTI